MATVFERICTGEIPASIVYEDTEVVAFRDIKPEAPVHVLIVPRRPLANLGEAGEADLVLLGRILLVAEQVARSLGVAERGYRLVLNNGEGAGQVVPHLHFHLLAGREMGWPPG